jgi:pyruvate dehydrogenase E1 component
MRYLHRQREQLGGYLPRRQTDADRVAVPELATYASFATAAAGKEMSTTMAFVRLLGNLLKDKLLGPRIVPIVADEARTFGMANLFKQIGIYSSVGQSYEPEDIGSVLSYREALDGQILEEGISEAGAIASWTAAATSYSVHGIAMLPFYIYYSMFGFQRVGDAIWAAADQRSRGFLLGATSGRTTLACSTKMAAATWWPPPSPTARPTIRRSPARWRPSSTTACAKCWWNRRTSSTT